MPGPRNGRVMWARLTSFVPECGRALVVAVLTGVLCSCGDGSGSSQKAYTLTLESDAPCYGARVAIDLEALAKGNGSCRASAEIAASGCSTDTYTDGDTLVAEARGCMIDAGTRLFDCMLGTSSATAVEDATSVAYDCGCQEACPTTVSIDATATTGILDGASTHPGTAGTTVATDTALASTTTSSFCGTCCDYYVNASVDMAAASRVTEIAFVLTFAHGGDECPFDPYDCQFAVATDGPSYIRKVDRTLEFCLSDSAGIDAAATLVTCELLAASFASPPLTVTRANGENLENLDPPPALTLDDGF